MSVYSTTRNQLTRDLAMPDECIILESTIIGMIMADSDSMIICKLLKCFFYADGLISCDRFHEEDIFQPCEMIHKDSGGCVTLLCELARHLCNESRMKWNHLVKWYNFPCRFGKINLWWDTLGWMLGAPWYSSHTTKEAHRKLGYWNFFKIPRDLTQLGKMLQLVKWHVT